MTERCSSLEEAERSSLVAEHFSALQNKGILKEFTLNEVLRNRALLEYALEMAKALDPNHLQDHEAGVENLRVLVDRSELESANPSKLFRRELAVQGWVVASGLEAGGILDATTLMREDILIAALNSYASADYFQLPISPILLDSTRDTWTMDPHFNPWLGARFGARFSREELEGHLERVQAVARSFREVEDPFSRQTARILGGEEYAKTGAGSYLIPSRSALNIHSIQAQKEGSRLELGAQQFPDKRFNVDLLAGTSVCIPAAALPFVRELPFVLNHPVKVPFVVNEGNPFLAETFRTTADLAAARNIEVKGGNFAEMGLAEDSVGLLILTALHGEDEGDLYKMLKQAQSFVRKGGTVMLWEVGKPGDKNSPVDLVQQRLDKRKFEVVQSKTGNGGARSMEADLKALIDLSAPELLRVLEKEYFRPAKSRTFSVVQLKKKV